MRQVWRYDQTQIGRLLYLLLVWRCPLCLKTKGSISECRISSVEAVGGVRVRIIEQSTLDKIAESVSTRLTERCCDFYKLGVWSKLLQQLTNGQSVSITQLADNLHLSYDTVSEILQQLPDTEFDQQGDIVGMGLSLNPTPHHFRVNGYTLFTWCALDALIYPVTLGQAAQVSSKCPVTGYEVRFSVGPDAIKHLNPATAVVSIVIPEAAQTCCRSNFCDQGNFFSSFEPASAWLSAQSQVAYILSVDDAFQVGYKLAKKLIRIEMETLQ